MGPKTEVRNTLWYYLTTQDESSVEFLAAAYKRTQSPENQVLKSQFYTLDRRTL